MFLTEPVAKLAAVMANTKFRGVFSSLRCFANLFFAFHNWQLLRTTSYSRAAPEGHLSGARSPAPYPRGLFSSDSQGRGGKRVRPPRLMRCTLAQAGQRSEAY